MLTGLRRSKAAPEEQDSEQGEHRTGGLQAAATPPGELSLGQRRTSGCPLLPHGKPPAALCLARRWRRNTTAQCDGSSHGAFLDTSTLLPNKLREPPPTPPPRARKNVCIWLRAPQAASWKPLWQDWTGPPGLVLSTQLYYLV